MNIIEFILNLVRTLIGQPKTQNGIILPKVSGSSEPFVPSVYLENGDWLPYLTKPYETQYTGFDQLNCVTKSGMHVVEAILNYCYKEKKFPLPQMYELIEKGGYLNDQGFIDLSERFTAKMAGTTKKGLGMDAFWNSINAHGFVPKKIWPEANITDWDTYYAEIPEDVKKAGLLSKEIFQWVWKVELNNSWITPPMNTIKEVLKTSPIHFATCLCNRDSAGVMRYCGQKIYQHAMTLYQIDDYQEILDQYDPFLRKSEAVYPLGCAIKVALKLQ